MERSRSPRIWWYALALIVTAFALGGCAKIAKRMTSGPTTGPTSGPTFGLAERVALRGLAIPLDLADPTNLPSSFPTKLSQTGLFDSARLAAGDLVAAAGVIELSVVTPLWSDGASKRRWIALPEHEQIGFSAQGPWTFPTGTILIKHFELPTSVTAVKRLETRLLIHYPSGWFGFVYQWTSATDAELLPATTTATDTVAVYDSSTGTTTNQTWRYLSRNACLSCHQAASGSVLGVRTHQLNSDFAYPTMKDNQLRAWNHIGMFTSDIGATAQYAAYAPVADETASLESRARAYLATNCAHCHQPAGSMGNLGMDFRFTTALADTALIGVAIQDTGSSYASSNPYRITAGSKGSSMVYARMSNTGSGHMPPLGVSIIDSKAVSLVGRWIDGLH